MTTSSRSEDGPNGGVRHDSCEGCHECGLRCTSGIQMTKREFERIVACLRGQDRLQVSRVLEQEKRVPWFEDIEMEHCLFYDVAKRRCIVYQERPLVCRLFGRVAWLPCPLGKPLTMLRDGQGLIRAYAREVRKTFADWCNDEGVFDIGGVEASVRPPSPEPP